MIDVQKGLLETNEGKIICSQSKLFDSIQIEQQNQILKGTNIKEVLDETFGDCLNHKSRSGKNEGEEEIKGAEKYTDSSVNEELLIEQYSKF